MGKAISSMTQRQMLMLQAILSSLQFINAGIATLHIPPIIPILIAGVAAGIQTYLQLLGNMSQPAEDDAEDSPRKGA